MLLTDKTVRSLRLWGIMAAVGSFVLAVLFSMLLETPAAKISAWLGGLCLGWFVYRWQTAVIRRRRRILATPFPTVWREELTESVSYYRHLQPEDAQRFEQLLAIFLAETRITGVGMVLDDRHRILVGAAAVIPIMGLAGWEYRYLSEILVYPERFDHEYQTGSSKDQRILGMVHGALNNGVMILSLPALIQGFRDPRDKRNVGLHEFAHIIDKQDGTIDGVPRSLSPPIAALWRSVLAEIFKEGKPFPNRIDAYGQTNPQEFFAVLTEHYFENPASLKKHHPPLYAVMEQMYQQQLRPQKVQLLSRKPE